AVAEPALAHRGEIDRRTERAVGLVRADVRGRFLAPDVLFARLQREHVRAPSRAVDRLADEPTGDAAEMRFGSRDEADVRPAVRDRVAERLRLAGADLRAPRGRRRQRRE